MIYSDKTAEVQDPDVPDRSYGDYYCKLCDSHMNSDNMWDAHITEKRHIKNVKKGDTESKYEDLPDVESTIKYELRNVKDPVVGLSYIHEIRRKEPNVPPIYNCFLCHASIATVPLVTEHVISMKHRLNYIKENNPDEYQLIEATNLKKGHMEPLVIEAARKMEQQVGRGTVKVKQEKKKDPVSTLGTGYHKKSFNLDDDLYEDRYQKSYPKNPNFEELGPPPDVWKSVDTGRGSFGRRERSRNPRGFRQRSRSKSPRDFRERKIMYSGDDHSMDGYKRSYSKRDRSPSPLRDTYDHRSFSKRAVSPEEDYHSFRSKTDDYLQPSRKSDDYLQPSRKSDSHDRSSYISPRYESPNPRESSSISYPSANYQKSANTKNSESVMTLSKGVCGLLNLGNTCFMNTALQCLAHIPPLLNYFLYNHYLKDLNLDYGEMQGKLAIEFASIIKRLWSGKEAFFAPEHFMQILAKLSPDHFGDHGQHDCQELLSFILEVLNDDLNQDKSRSQKEVQESAGPLEEVVARESEDDYLKNKSEIMKIFYGELKSTICCEECLQENHKYDGFMLLSLPLPTDDLLLKITVITKDVKIPPTKIKINMPSLGSTTDLWKALSSMIAIPEKNLVIATGTSHRIHKILEEDDQVIDIKKKEIFAFEVPEICDPDHQFLLPVYMREMKDRRLKNKPTRKMFGNPSLLAISSKTYSFDSLYNIMLKVLSRLFKKISDDEHGAKLYPDKEITKTKKKMPCMEQKPFTLYTVHLENHKEVYKELNPGSIINLQKNMELIVEFEEKKKKIFLDDKEIVAFTPHISLNLSLPHTKNCTLEDCVNIFTRLEYLGKRNLVLCSNCKKPQKVTKKLAFHSLPPVLIFHLKRFNSAYGQKLQTFVKFPLKDFMINNSEDSRYNLIAISNHYGAINGGHYIAYFKNASTGDWYIANDDKVTKLTEDVIVTKNAYLLFYMKKNYQPGI